MTACTGDPRRCAFRRAGDTQPHHNTTGHPGPRGYLPVGEEKMTASPDSFECASLALDIRKMGPQVSPQVHALLPLNMPKAKGTSTSSVLIKFVAHFEERCHLKCSIGRSIADGGMAEIHRAYKCRSDSGFSRLITNCGAFE